MKVSTDRHRMKLSQQSPRYSMQSEGKDVDLALLRRQHHYYDIGLAKVCWLLSFL